MAWCKFNVSIVY